jgi:hypothetical protein
MCFNIILKSVNYFMQMICIVLTLYASDLQTARKTQILGVNFPHLIGEYLIFAYSFLDLKLLSVVTISVAWHFKMSSFHFMLCTKAYFHRELHLQTLWNSHPLLTKHVPWIRAMYTVTLFASYLLSFASIQINSRKGAAKFSDLKLLLI